MRDTAAAETPPEAMSDGREESRANPVGTPIAVVILYVLGILAGTVLAGSVLFVVLAYATSGSGGIGLNVSLPSFVICLGLVIAAGGTFVWRRWESPR